MRVQAPRESPHENRNTHLSYHCNDYADNHFREARTSRRAVIIACISLIIVAIVLTIIAESRREALVGDSYKGNCGERVGLGLLLCGPHNTRGSIRHQTKPDPVHPFHCSYILFVIFAGLFLFASILTSTASTPPHYLGPLDHVCSRRSTSAISGGASWNKLCYCKPAWQRRLRHMFQGGKTTRRQADWAHGRAEDRPDEDGACKARTEGMAIAIYGTRRHP